MPSIGERFLQHGKNYVFRGGQPDGGHEGSSQVENLQAIYRYKFEPGDWWLGRVHDWDLAAAACVSFEMGHKDERHLWVMGATRSRKGTSQIIPNILLHPGNQMIVDPKGEAYEVCAAALKAQGKRVVLLDPMRVCATRKGLAATGDECGLNPLIDINPYDPQAPRLIAELANILIEKPEGGESGGSAYWHKLTRNVCAGLLAFALVYQNKAIRKIVKTGEAKAKVKAGFENRPLRGDDFDYTDREQRLIHSFQNMVSFAADFSLKSPEEQMDIIAMMLAFEQSQINAGREPPTVSRMIKMGGRSAFTLLGPKADPEGMRSLLTMFDNSFIWVDSDMMINDLKGLDFKFRMSDLKTQDDLVVFVVLPDTALESHGAWLRMVITTAVNSISRNDWAPGVNPDGYKIHMILDECPQYQKVPALERLFSVCAGQDVRAIVISQNKTQMDEIYRPGVVASLIANSAQILLSGGDNETGKYFSDKAGKTYKVDEETGEKGDDKVEVWQLDEIWKVVHHARDTLTYWENGQGPLRVRLCEYMNEFEAGVHYTQHRKHVALEDMILTRGGCPSLVSRPKGSVAATAKEKRHAVAGQHIMISNGSSDQLPVVKQ